MKVIAFEGPDRVGKATQCKLLCEYINNALKKKAVVVEVPVHDVFTYSLIYWMLRNGLAKKFPKVFQWLQILNRWIFQKVKLSSLKKKYDYVIFDRWSLSTIVYGTAEGLVKEDVEEACRLLTSPDYTIVLLGKSHAHEAEDVYERDENLQRKVREIYATWVKENPNVSSVVGCEMPALCVAAEVQSILRHARMLSPLTSN